MTQYFDDMCMLGVHIQENTLWFHIVISSSHQIICGFLNNDFYVVNNMGLSLMKKTESKVFCIFKMWQRTQNSKGRTLTMSNDLV